jgi:hypothetical protein
MKEIKMNIWKTDILQESTYITAPSEVYCAVCTIRSASNLRVKA